MKTLGRLCALLTALSLPVILDSQAVAQAAALNALTANPHPYWLPANAELLYLRAPVVILSACVLLLTPGLLLSIAAGAARTMTVWILTGLLFSIPVVSVAAGVVQSVTGSPLTNGAFALTVVATSLACLVLVVVRIARGASVVLPWQSPNATTIVAALVCTGFAILVAMAPKFYWESFNGDGAHTFEATRLLLQQPVPFWSRSAGDISGFPGITSALYIYPGSWFLRLFGGIEAAVRIPWILFLSGLICAIIAVAEWGSHALSRAAYWCVCLGVTVYAVTMAYSATYSPYSADIALPATQDTLLMVCFLAYVLFLLDNRPWLMAFSLALTYAALPSGFLLIMMWLLAVAFWRPRPRRLIMQSLLALVVCIAAGVVIVRLLPALGLPAPGGEYGLASLLRYFVFLEVTDWRRILYVIVPGGILPGLAMLAWRHHDNVARSLVLVTMAYFVFFYVQANIALHHFVPAMILPLAIFWRSAGSVAAEQRPRVLWAVGALGFVSLLLSLPRNAALDMTSREVGMSLEDRIPGYEQSNSASFRHTKLLERLFPVDWDPTVPENAFGGSPLIWLYYAHHPSSGSRMVNYVLQRRSDVAPARARLIATDDEADIFVVDDSLWLRQLALRPATPAGSRVYEVQRGTLFRSESKPGHGVISVVDVLGSAGVDTARLMRRLGVKR